MLTITFPESYEAELRYLLQVIFTEHLDIQFDAFPTGDNCCRITRAGYPGELVIDTELFSCSPEKWLTPKSLPETPLNRWKPADELPEVELIEDSLPVIYGKPGLSRNGEEWHLHLDLFGSIFFMLSRYEELITSERDAHNRFIGNNSLACQEGFLERPIVDEYVEILWACLSGLWPDLSRPSSDPGIEISCDVDQPFDCTVENLTSMVKACGGDIVKRADLIEACKRINRYVFSKLGIYRFDPYYTFDWYLDQCENNDLKATFYVIADSSEPLNGCYRLSDQKIKRLLKQIHARGHRIGMHGSYQSYMSPEILVAQKTMLQQSLAEIGIEEEIRHNRQHYLRWDASVTADYLQQAGFEFDSSGTYADVCGFRYGTAKEFSMWGWASGGPLLLKQRPLIVMETSVLDADYLELGTGQAARDYMDRLKQRALHFGGKFSLLWHNSALRNKAEMNLFLDMIS